VEPRCATTETRYIRCTVAQEWTRPYAGSSDRVFTACLQTVTRLNWKIQHTDATTRTLSCAAKGKKIRLGGGQDMSLIVEATGANAKVVLGWVTKPHDSLTMVRRKRSPRCSSRPWTP
jgi:hypothetical protein